MDCLCVDHHHHHRRKEMDNFTSRHATIVNVKWFSPSYRLRIELGGQDEAPPG